MSFTVDEFHDLVRILEQQPEWRAELRRQLLSEDLLTLPQLVRELAVAQQRTEVRVAELAEAQQRTEARLAELAEAQQRTETRVAELAVAQQRTEARVAELAEAQQRTEARLGQLEHAVATLVEVVQKLGVDVGGLKGQTLELQYQRRAPSYFRPIILRAHVLSPDETNELIEDAVDRGQLTDAEAADVILADVLVRGRFRPDGRQVYLVAEVSWGVGVEDVRRAIDRSALLAKAGVEAIPVVAGAWLTSDAQAYADTSRIWVVTDGRVVEPPAA